MKKRRSNLLIGLVAISLLLGGCGTPMYELTAEEEALIVQYSAYYIAKRNIYQKDGLSNAEIQEETETIDSSEDTQEPEDTQTPSGNGGSSEDTQTPSGTITIAEVIGAAEGLEITYKGNSQESHYKEGDYYSVDAGEGYVFYVMQFEIKNTSDKEISVDNAAENPIFRLKSGSLSGKSAVTFLSNDFSTYKGTIEAGESVETILLFKVQESKVDSITDPVLQITVDNVTKNVEL